jgi:hypothetical protein
MTVSLDDREREVLTQANEDYSGLYELVWAFRSRFMPEASEDAIIGAARDAVRFLIDRGYVRLVRFRQQPDQEVSDVSAEEVASILEDPASWRPPASWEQAYPSVDATEAGRRAWRLPNR